MSNFNLEGLLLSGGASALQAEGPGFEFRQVHFFSQKGVLQLKLVLGIQRRVKFSNEN